MTRTCPDDFVGGFLWCLNSGFLGGLAAWVLVGAIFIFAVCYCMNRWGPK